MRWSFTTLVVCDGRPVCKMKSQCANHICRGVHLKWFLFITETCKFWHFYNDHQANKSNEIMIILNVTKEKKPKPENEKRKKSRFFLCCDGERVKRNDFYKPERFLLDTIIKTFPPEIIKRKNSLQNSNADFE